MYHHPEHKHLPVHLHLQRHDRELQVYHHLEQKPRQLPLLFPSLRQKHQVLQRQEVKLGRQHKAEVEQELELDLSLALKVDC